MNVTVEWECPACGKTTEVPGDYGKVVHRCPKMGGLTTPYVRKGAKAKLSLVMREDYIGSEKVQTDDEGRPVMAIVTERDNGRDTRVFAPVATVGVKGQTIGVDTNG